MACNQAFLCMKLSVPSSSLYGLQIEMFSVFIVTNEIVLTRDKNKE